MINSNLLADVRRLLFSPGIPIPFLKKISEYLKLLMKHDVVRQRRQHIKQQGALQDVQDLRLLKRLITPKIGQILSRFDESRS